MVKEKISLLSGREDPLPLAMIIGLFQSFALGYVSLGIVYYAADRFGAGSAVIGLLAASYTASYAVSCFVLNKAISRLRPYHAILLGVAIQLILSQIAIRVPSLGLLSVVYLLFGLSTGLVWPPLMGWMSRGRDGERLNRSMSVYNFSWSIPWMLSPYITGLLYEISPILPFHVSTLFSLLVILVILIYLNIFKEVKDTAKSEHNLKKTSSREEDKSTPLRYLTWISLFPSFLLMGLFISIVPIFLRSAFSLSESRVGLVILIRALVTIIVFYIMGRTSKWHFNRKMILLATPIMALLLGLFTGATALWHYVLWTVLVGLIVGYTYTNSMFHCLSGAVERQKRMNIHEIILTAAMLAGSLLGGAFLDRFGMDFIMIFVAIITVVSFIMQWAVDYYFRKRKKSV